MQNVKVMSRGVRQLMVGISLLAIVVGSLLYLFPDHTDTLFAWTISPPLTAMFLGGGYLSALVIELLAARERVWAYARAMFPGMLIFTALTLVATGLHIDRFHVNSPQLLARLTAWAWIIVYLLAPIAMLGLLVRQVRAPGQDPPRRAVLTRGYRALLFGEGVVMLLVGAPLFVTPQAASLLWPWSLTPLTSRAIGAWLVGIGFGFAHSAYENAWERIRAATIGNFVMGVLQLIALARFVSTVGWSGVTAWLYLFFCIAMVVIGGYGWYRTQQV